MMHLPRTYDCCHNTAAKVHGTIDETSDDSSLFLEDLFPLI